MTIVLFHILVVLIAAKLAAEVAERAGIPAVVGEITAGILVGPSALNLVAGDDVLRVLGELGAIILLLEVGLEMDLVELKAVGRASLTVALIGVAAPFLAGSVVALGFGMDGRGALFVGAALTATSVGITARVFGDLRALASVEARTVLGAAVADDVIGLVILTVVVRIASEGQVSAGTVGIVLATAASFLVLALGVGMKLAPPLFGGLARRSRSRGTLVAMTLAFTLGVAALANAAKLAPIVGAFVAGLSLTRSSAAGRIRGQLAPVGHLFIPVFFLQIGIDAEVGRFARPGVLVLAGALLAVGVIGKLAAAAGMIRAPGDRLLVGIGMVPRGEVGLIFAAIGLRQGVFDQDIYAALLLVVLATTLLTPPALRLRLEHLRRGASRRAMARTGGAPGGWLRVDQAAEDRLVEMAAEPGRERSLAVALEAALLCEKARPGSSVLDWLSSFPPGPLRWDREARQRFFLLLETGGPRSWRLLAVTGVLERALPELTEALARRASDFELDPLGALRWPRLSRLQEAGDLASEANPERVRLAAFLLDATDLHPTAKPVVIARRVTTRLDLGARAEEAVAQMVADDGLLPAAARRPDGFSEEPVLQLATHLGSLDLARGEFALARADDQVDDAQWGRLAELEVLVLAALARPELTGREARNAFEERRRSACRLTGDPEVRERIETAPRAYVLAARPEDLVVGARLGEPLPASGTVRVAVALRAEGYRLTLAARDRPGLLANQAGVLSRHDLDVLELVVAVWGDGCAVSSFGVRGPMPDVAALEAALTAPITWRSTARTAPDAVVTFNDRASPWHTVCSVQAPDRLGLLHALTTAFAAAGASVHAARGATAEGEVIDVFELTDGKGHKLGAEMQNRIRRFLAEGASAPLRSRRRRKPRPT